MKRDNFTLGLDLGRAIKRTRSIWRGMLAELAHPHDQDLTLLDMMPLPNVWIGATIVNQEEADRDIPKLLALPARVRFLSMEPLLGPANLTRIPVSGGGFHEFDPLVTANVLQRPEAYPPLPQVDWVIVGGESGPGARPMHPGWARGLRDQCAAAGVPFLFKQWGEWVPRSACYHTFADGKSCADYDPGATQWHCIRLTESGHNGRSLENADGGDDAYMQRIGKKAAGRLLDGHTWDRTPTT